ncbi:MAG: prepilin-type N-terminal cleavage/methylation domain-containing protein [Desulfobacterales bacterium]|nr:prepilin-type N-terminal cleavage/methylation domain-containing protein [Desulfobacterales bacterium]
MTNSFVKSIKGFSLIELMIVVAIIGILSAIAIPNFINYQLKSKTAEAKTNLGTIKTVQEAYKAENSSYVVCTASPNATPNTSKQPWVDQGGGFGAIGFIPLGDVYYSYAVTSVDTATSFTATATGNLDGDATSAVYTITQSSTLSGPVPSGAF